MKKDIAIQKTSTLMHPVPIPIKVMSSSCIDIMKMERNTRWLQLHDQCNRLLHKICRAGSIERQICSDSWQMDL